MQLSVCYMTTTKRHIHITNFRILWETSRKVVISLSNSQATVTDAAFQTFIRVLRKLLPWMHGDNIGVIFWPPLLLMPLHIFRYLVKCCTYFCKSTFHRFNHMGQSEFDIIRNLQVEIDSQSNGSRIVDDIVKINTITKDISRLQLFNVDYQGYYNNINISSQLFSFNQKLVAKRDTH